jgi:catechol 2,3-dioxygenase-like lactoylglutathione lyase family enzyme
MRLNHLNLTVDDVPAAHAFLAKHFGMASIACNQNMGFLRDDAGAVISLTSLKVARESQLRYPGGFHVGFIQESEAQVDAINRRLREDGLEVGPPQRLHGSWTFYFTAPGGFTVEVLC